MSDPGRKDLDTKLKEKIVPESMKSDAQKMKEAVTDTADKTAREVQPDHSKSTTQDMADKVGRGKDTSTHGSTHESVGDKFKHALHTSRGTHTTHTSATAGTTAPTSTLTSSSHVDGCADGCGHAGISPIGAGGSGTI